MSEEWQALTEEQRKPYEEMNKKEKDWYEKEVKEYKARANLKACKENADAWISEAS